MPDRMRNSQLFLLISERPVWAPVRKTINQAMSTTTIVRMAVARLELTPSIPILARIEVNAAKMEERRAKTNHIKAPPDSFILLHTTIVALSIESCKINLKREEEQCYKKYVDR